MLKSLPFLAWWAGTFFVFRPTKKAYIKVSLSKWTQLIQRLHYIQENITKTLHFKVSLTFLFSCSYKSL